MGKSRGAGKEYDLESLDLTYQIDLNCLSSFIESEWEASRVIECWNNAILFERESNNWAQRKDVSNSKTPHCSSSKPQFSLLKPTDYIFSEV